MATDNQESFIEKTVEFFTQKRSDFDYEQAGGDSKIPEDERTDDAKYDANVFAVKNGKEAPWPLHKGGPKYTGDTPVEETAVVVEDDTPEV